MGSKLPWVVAYIESELTEAGSDSLAESTWTERSESGTPETLRNHKKLEPSSWRAARGWTCMYLRR